MLTMNIQDVVNCSFPNWYCKFSKCTLTSEILELPDDVLEYLLHTGTLVLPASSHSITSTSSTSNGSAPQPAHQQDSDEEDGDQVDWSTDQATAVQAPGLEEFTNRMRAAIARLGGTVFPKLNWTAPKDAAWMSFTNSLQCHTPGDVYLLLKSSNLLNRDLTHPFKDCCDEMTTSITAVRPVLVLRQWREINPSCEFRCFVKDGHFIGFCPRDVSQHYPCLGTERSSIVGDLASFWRENIDNRFPLRSYVFDCVRLAKDRVLLVDFSPLHQSRTNSLLYDWDELRRSPLPPPVTLSSSDELENLELEICDSLQTMNLQNTDSNRAVEALAEEQETATSDADAELPEFRYISSETGVQPSHDRLHGLPVDFLDLCSGQDPYKLMDLLQLKVQSNRDENSSSSDEEAGGDDNTS